MIARIIVAVAFFAVLAAALLATPRTGSKAYGVYYAAAPYYPGFVDNFAQGQPAGTSGRPRYRSTNLQNVLSSPSAFSS
jgi:hypothetical protein